ncbi:hypothetical protein [Carnobacterium maltaromaticum]|uniref:hypothetical protein n=1 Tax=Carnobacterium maltaromaticum TaxID=2751 RepID=UPI00295F0CD5|nr:hypothetical protein [Carnobacterium maltaromaticum]
MKVLEINSGKSYFNVGDEQIVPEEISRENLLKILNDIYEVKDEEVVIPDRAELNVIRNPVEKEIVQQIIQKILEFKNNVDNIKQEIDVQFPLIQSQENA